MREDICNKAMEQLGVAKIRWSIGRARWRSVLSAATPGCGARKGAGPPCRQVETSALVVVAVGRATGLERGCVLPLI